MIYASHKLLLPAVVQGANIGYRDLILGVLSGVGAAAICCLAMGISARMGERGKG